MEGLALESSSTESSIGKKIFGKRDGKLTGLNNKIRPPSSPNDKIMIERAKKLYTALDPQKITKVHIKSLASCK